MYEYGTIQLFMIFYSKALTLENENQNEEGWIRSISPVIDKSAIRIFVISIVMWQQNNCNYDLKTLEF